MDWMLLRSTVPHDLDQIVSSCTHFSQAKCENNHVLKVGFSASFKAAHCMRVE